MRSWVRFPHHRLASTRIWARRRARSRSFPMSSRPSSASMCQDISFPARSWWSTCFLAHPVARSTQPHSPILRHRLSCARTTMSMLMSAALAAIFSRPFSGCRSRFPLPLRSSTSAGNRFSPSGWSEPSTAASTCAHRSPLFTSHRRPRCLRGRCGHRAREHRPDGRRRCLRSADPQGGRAPATLRHPHARDERRLAPTARRTPRRRPAGLRRVDGGTRRRRSGCDRSRHTLRRRDRAGLSERSDGNRSVLCGRTLRVGSRPTTQVTGSDGATARPL